MKIQINYDLLNKIFESKTGIDIKYNLKFISMYSTIATSCKTLMNNPTLEPNQFFQSLTSSILTSTASTIMVDIFFNKIKKNLALEELKELSLLLKTINIHTNYELLQEAKKYKTERKVSLNLYESPLPKIEEKKYITIPVFHNGETKEISIVQEHIIGTKKYSISQGEPEQKKVLKLAYNNA